MSSGSSTLPSAVCCPLAASSHQVSRPQLPNSHLPPLLCEPLAVLYCSWCLPAAAVFDTKVDESWREVRLLVRPTWPFGTTFLRCDTCCDLNGDLFLLCPACADTGRSSHRQGAHHFSPLRQHDISSTTTTSSSTTAKSLARRPMAKAPMAKRPMTALSPSQLPVSATRLVNADDGQGQTPSSDAGSGRGGAGVLCDGAQELDAATFESVVYDDARDVVVCWKNTQRIRHPRDVGLSHLTQQGKLSFGHACHLLLDSFQRLLTSQQQQQRAGASVPSVAEGGSHDCGEWLRCVSFDAGNHSAPPTSSLWMDSNIDPFHVDSRLFGPRNTRQLIAQHGGIFICPARQRKGECAAEQRDVLVDECYSFDPKRLDDWLVRREAPALWTSSAPYSPMFRLPTMSQLCTFIHRHMRHGSIPLDALLQRVEQQRLDEVIGWLNRMMLATTQYSSAIGHYVMPDWSKPEQLSSLPLELQTTLQERRSTFSDWVIGWMSLLYTPDTRLELLPQLDSWPQWQSQLAELESFLASLRQVEAWQRQASIDMSDVTRRIHRHATLVCRQRSLLRPVGNRLDCFDRRPVHPAFFSESRLVQVVSSSFEELVLDPNVDVFVLFFNEHANPGDRFTRATLLAPLLVNLHAMCQLLRTSAQPVPEDGDEQSKRYRHQQQQQSSPSHPSPRFAVMDCHRDEPDVDWLPIACYRYWSAFQRSSLVSYPALPIPLSCSFEDYDQRRQQAAEYDWSWGGRIMQQCYARPHASQVDVRDLRDVVAAPGWDGVDQSKRVYRTARWSGEELILPSLSDTIRWVHTQCRRDSFDLHDILRRAEPLAALDRIHRQLRSAHIHWTQWDTMQFHQGHTARRLQRPVNYDELDDRARELAAVLPPAVPLDQFEAERVRDEFAPFIEHVNAVCLPQLRTHWLNTQQGEAKTAEKSDSDSDSQ